MSNLYSVLSLFEACNFHLGLYAALGWTLVLQGVFAFREHRYDEAREHGVHGIIYIILGML